MRLAMTKWSAVGLTIGALMSFGCRELASAQQSTQGVARVVGTIQSISGKSLTVLSDRGAAAPVTVEDATKFLQIEPGKTDLKEATPITFGDLQLGDRVLVRGIVADDGTTVRAASVIAVKKAALAEKQAKERAEWQRGVGGLVKSIDSNSSTISLTTNGIASSKEVLVHFTKDTIFRRYASDSTRFDAARVAPLTEIQPGDQLRARGTRREGEAELAATEIVSGTFRSIAGTVISSDVSSNSLVVQELASKSVVTLKINGESQMRKLPAPFAEGLAARLKNQSAGGPGASAPSPQGQATLTSQQGAAPGVPQGGRGGGDFQQMIARMPAATLSDLQKGDAVMVVTTQGNGKDPLTVITLLGGVEPILRSSPKGSQDMILSPWSLGGGEPAGN
jgi:Cu/Ag efflux protein CusF